MPEFTVEVSGHFTEQSVFIVEADSEEHACDLARARYHTQHPSWEGAVRDAKVVDRVMTP